MHKCIEECIEKYAMFTFKAVYYYATNKRPATIKCRQRDLGSQKCWFDFSNSLLIPVYQIRNYISHDYIWTCTKIYKNNSKILIPDSRIVWILLVIPLIPGAINVIRNRGGLLGYQTMNLLALVLSFSIF